MFGLTLPQPSQYVVDFESCRRGGYLGLGLGPPVHETPHADTLVQQAADARATFL